MIDWNHRKHISNTLQILYPNTEENIKRYLVKGILGDFYFCWNIPKITSIFLLLYPTLCQVDKQNNEIISVYVGAK